MSTPDPLDLLLDQISDLLAVAQENKGEAIKGKVDKDIEQQLDFLEQKVEFFRKVTDEAIKMSGVNEEELEKNIKESVEDPQRKNQKMVARAERLKTQMQMLEKEYEQRGKLAKLQKKRVKATGKKRKKKFKKLGGQGWLPL